MEPVYIFCCGAVFFPSVYVLFTITLRRLFGHKLTPADIATISVKCVSSIQAILSSLAGAVIVSVCTDIMHDTHWLTNSYACFGLPYFYYDVWAMYQVHKLNHGFGPSQKFVHCLQQFAARNKMMMLHHILLPLVLIPVILFIRRDQGDFFVGVFYMIELTIPFISAREIMVQLNLKSSQWYVMVGLMMIGVFTITRILVFPFLYHAYAVHAQLPLWQVPAAIPLKCNLGCLLLLLPQIYWWALMVRGAFRVFSKILSSSSKEP